MRRTQLLAFSHGFDDWSNADTRWHSQLDTNAFPDACSDQRDHSNFARNGIPLGPLDGFAADLVSREAIFWLREIRDQSKPFFRFVSYHEPHEPIETIFYPHFVRSKASPLQRSCFGRSQHFAAV